MTKKIIYTLLIILAIVAGGILLDVGNYEVSQEYALRAADSLNDDSAYTELQTQQGVNKIFDYVYYGFSLLLIFLGVKVWLPKK